MLRLIDFDHLSVSDSVVPGYDLEAGDNRFISLSAQFAAMCETESDDSIRVFLWERVGNSQLFFRGSFVWEEPPESPFSAVWLDDETSLFMLMGSGDLCDFDASGALDEPMSEALLWEEADDPADDIIYGHAIDGDELTVLHHRNMCSIHNFRSPDDPLLYERGPFQLRHSRDESAHVLPGQLVLISADEIV